jgi:uncharacterized protein (TIGR00297 family)
MGIHASVGSRRDFCPLLLRCRGMGARAKDIAAVSSLVGLAAYTAVNAGWGRSLVAASVTAAFATGAYWLRGVDAGGAMAGACVAFVFFAQGGPRMFAVLLLAFVLTLAATRLGPMNGDREGHPGAGRRASQIGANLMAATAVAATADLLGPSAHLLVLAMLAELAGDTVSSEIGEAYGGPPYLLTTLRQVEPGTDGAVSLLGSLAGTTAIAASVAAGAKLLSVPEAAVLPIMGAAFFGMLMDSVLGAVLERRGKLSNDGVNLIATVAAGAACYRLVGA